MNIKNICLGLLLVSSATVAVTASARTLSPAIGVPVNSAITSYFYDTTGPLPNLGFRNHDTAAHAYLFAIPADTAGAKTVNVIASRTSAGAVNCTLNALNADGSVASSSTATLSNVPGAHALLTSAGTAMSVTLPLSGTLHLNCGISGSDTAKIHSIDYNP